MAFWSSLKSSALCAKGKGHWGECHSPPFVSKENELPSEEGSATHLRIPPSGDTKYAYIRHIKAEDPSKDSIEYEDCKVHKDHVRYDDCVVWEDRVVYQRSAPGVWVPLPLQDLPGDCPTSPVTTLQAQLKYHHEVNLPFIHFHFRGFNVYV